MTRSGARSIVPPLCLTASAAIWLILAIAPADRADWLLENLPVFVLVPAAVLLHRRHPFSDRACVQAAIFATLHTIGSHHTYSDVPLGFWLRDLLGLTRNHYDRLVHFAFGALMLRPMRELAFRRQPLAAPAEVLLAVTVVGWWSGAYEITEWIVASLADPAAGTAYLGTQGDQWDAQKDMACALAGAVLASAVEIRHRPAR